MKKQSGKLASYSEPIFLPSTLSDMVPHAEDSAAGSGPEQPSSCWMGPNGWRTVHVKTLRLQLMVQPTGPAPTHIRLGSRTLKVRF